MKIRTRVALSLLPLLATGCRSAWTPPVRADGSVCCAEPAEAPPNASPRPDVAAASASDVAPDPAASRATFARLAALAGTWRGRSTKGWEDEVTIEVIAAGTVVVLRSFGAHPGETMLTLAHMDGDRLMMSHYCVAKNQPRYVAREFADDGKKVTFEFLDGTNMASRDVGHMDGVVYRFLDDSAFTSTWSWYQNGKVDWMEEIEYVRQD